MNKKELILYGIKKGIPVVIGYIPMGIGYASIAMNAGIDSVSIVAMSIFVFAGAGQIMAVTMIGQGATLLIIILTNFVINFRYFIFNISIFNKVKDSNFLLNLLTAHLTVDESFAIFTLMEESSIWTYIGLAGISYLSWIFGAILGVIFLDFLPQIISKSFNISLYALFVAILVPIIKKNKQIGLVVIITIIINCILKILLGSNWSTLLAILLGAGIGMYIVDDEELMDG